MAKKPPLKDRVTALEKRVDLIESVLDIDPGSYLRCEGNPGACGKECKQETCPLQNGKIQDIGSILVSLIEEFRWHRAWADEMTYQGVYPVGTEERVQLRVKKNQLEALLRQAEADLGTVPGIQEEMKGRVAEIRQEIADIDGTLAEGC